MNLAPHVLLVALCAFVPFTAAQEGPPAPSPELKKLEPLIGNWSGSGTFNEPEAVTKWTAVGTYRWALGNFWVQEDLTITFEGNPSPLVFRAYVGWDGERKCFVNASVNNNGDVALHDVTLLPDGTLLQVMQQHQQGITYAERSRLGVVGDKMTHTIDLLMPEGPSMTIVDGTFKRGTAVAPSALDAKGTWLGTAAPESMQKLARMDGSYDVKGSMVMAPGMPATKITGVDSYRTIFGGTVQFVHTDGEAEGMPGKYECDSFSAWSTEKNCFVSIFVSNMGEVGRMEMRLAVDGKSLIATAAATMHGQPMVQRSIVALDDKGLAKSMVTHAILGSAAPFESFNMTYTKK